MSVPLSLPEQHPVMKSEKVSLPSLEDEAKDHMALSHDATRNPTNYYNSQVEQQWNSPFYGYPSHLYNYQYHPPLASGSTYQDYRYHPYGLCGPTGQTSHVPYMWYPQYSCSQVPDSKDNNSGGYVYDYSGSHSTSLMSMVVGTHPVADGTPEGSEDSGIASPTDLSGNSSPETSDVVDIPRITAKRSKSEAKDCMVCSRPATGFHYNVAACEGCKGFFRRVVALNKTYQCLGTGNCPKVTERTGCKACRIARCKAAGMDPRLVRAPFRKRRSVSVPPRDGFDYPALLSLLQAPVLMAPADTALTAP